MESIAAAAMARHTYIHAVSHTCTAHIQQVQQVWHLSSAMVRAEFVPRLFPESRGKVLPMLLVAAPLEAPLTDDTAGL